VIASGSQWWPHAARSQLPGVATMRSYETVGSRYQATTGEVTADLEDLVRAIV
jgi:hypothetical protein